MENPQHTVRGKQEVSLDDVNGNSCRATGSDGYGAKSESVRIGGTDCQGDNFQSSGESVPGTGGKILDLLEELFAGFHEYVKSHEARLEQRLASQPRLSISNEKTNGEHPTGDSPTGL
ncbi:hypothetical protein [Arthrospira platensis]|uniref:hypothetical protein n=1 Tax=Limnospira platensis TaxID=118562 RepID=UPI000ABA7B5D